MAEAGHTFLARLGKTRLRPGGKKATDWLLSQAHINTDTKVLEVACNMGTTTVELAEKTGAHIDAIDLDVHALEKAKANVAKKHLESQVTLHQGNAMHLPFEDESFDVVINEAMLTMLPLPQKEKCLREYFRVLKPNGVLLTHDVMLKKNDVATQKKLSEAINVQVTPLTAKGWQSLAKDAGFSKIETLQGEMSLMSMDGMIADEGWQGAAKILTNALKPENFARFQEMYRTFKDEKDKLGFIAMVSRKAK